MPRREQSRLLVRHTPDGKLNPADNVLLSQVLLRSLPPRIRLASIRGKPNVDVHDNTWVLQEATNDLHCVGLGTRAPRILFTINSKLLRNYRPPPKFVRRIQSVERLLRIARLWTYCLS